MSPNRINSIFWRKNKQESVIWRIEAQQIRDSKKKIRPISQRTMKTDCKSSEPTWLCVAWPYRGTFSLYRLALVLMIYFPISGENQQDCLWLFGTENSSAQMRLWEWRRHTGSDLDIYLFGGFCFQVFTSSSLPELLNYYKNNI